MKTDYLVVPLEYCRQLGGLCWSELADAIERDDGRTFALAAEVLAFLEGFASRRPLIHFGHVLHFLYLLRHGKTPDHDLTPLGRAWREAGRPARTAGAFASVLCRDVPAVPEPPTRDELAAWINVWSRVGARPLSVGTSPPLPAHAFEAAVASALGPYSFAEMVHWLQHGQGEVKEAGEKLARELLADKPRSLASVLAEVSKHDRLTGCVPYVSRLIGALALPPRRLFERDIPTGGYSDVTTRGQPEQLLPSQFALDEMEFLRRHAEHELLYYRRELPAARTREELVVLLDQGVRTWGRVRLVLTAGVFALAGWAEKNRLGPLLVATTGNGGRAVDPLVVAPNELADLLAKSDFGVHPGLALETLLERTSGEASRDIVLLTHPRSLQSSEVAAAARRLRPGWRLFAVTALPSGEAGVTEMRHGGLIPLTQFRLDLDTAPAPQVPPPPAAAWSGDVEAIGYPFRFGLSQGTDRPLFAFDLFGNRLLVAGPDGMLFAVQTDGTGHEVLPRPVLSGHVLTDVHDVTGVAGGFVVLAATTRSLVAAHYDFSARRCRLHEFPSPGKGAMNAEWRYRRGLHLLVVRQGEQFTGVELSTGQRRTTVPSRLRWAPAGAVPGLLSWQENTDPTGASAWRQPVLHFDATRGDIRVEDAGGNWQPFTPVLDNSPLLAGRLIRRAACRGDVLAVAVGGGRHRDEVFLFAAPHGVLIGSLGLPVERAAFELSPDGRLLAVQRGAIQIQVRQVQPGLPIRTVTPVGRFHNNLVLDLGEMWLDLTIDRTVHRISWRQADQGLSLAQVSVQDTKPTPFVRAQTGVPAFLQPYYSGRFRRYARSNLVAVLSAFGEVFLFNRYGRLLCGFFAFRHHLAAWMPDGTCLGPEVLLGCPPTPDAACKIGRALYDAWVRGGDTIQ